MTALRQQRNLVWLTLAAFSIQIFVGVLHHHGDRVTGFAARAMTAGLCSPHRDRLCLPGLPGRQDHDGCLLCWGAAVAANSLTPVLPQLPAPSAAATGRIDGFVSLPVSLIHRDNFQARGPPENFRTA